MLMRKFILTSILVIGSVAQVAIAAPLQEVGSEYSPLMAQAVREGKASTYLKGQFADYIRSQIGKPDAKILLTVTRIDEQGKAGCFGLKMHFTSPGTLLPMSDGTKGELDVWYYEDMCAK
jgi:hypothetical protein